MKVILQQDVPRLGKQGDVVEVNDGYARNYLLPRQLAKEATAGRLKEVERRRKSQASKEARAEKEARALAERLSGEAVVITARAGEGGRLFGSVTNQDIAAAIKKRFKLNIDRRKIELKEPLKALGEHNVTLRLFTNVTCEIKVQVVSE
ncbi:MAG TPA: 50S ribosomal protein L9 [Firmicutes bacterium]|jgi:large subunit ribosomal protein L9|nr:50S ribosomal protein L9 [Bacillota bacterium]